MTPRRRVEYIPISSMHSRQPTRCFTACSCLQQGSRSAHSVSTKPLRRQRRRQRRCAARQQTEEETSEDAKGERSRNRVIENELRDPSNFLEYLVPRPLRLVLTGSGAASCLIATVITGTQLLADLRYGGSGNAIPTVAINAAGGLFFAALFTADQRAADTRISRRDKVRKAQIGMGDREVFVNEEGERMSRLREVDSDWIIRRLERWGKRDRMPFIGPEKGALLRQIIRERQPRQVVEVGSMAGYSALTMAQALGPDGQVISLESDWKWALAAKRFVWQATQGDKSSKPVRLASDYGALAAAMHAKLIPLRWRLLQADQRCGRVDVWIGNAIDKIPQHFRSRPPIDLLFLDGTPSETLAYLKAAEPFLAEGATVVADNAEIFAAGGMKPYLEYVRSDDRYTSELMKCKLEWNDEIQDGLEVSRYMPPGPL